VQEFHWLALSKVLQASADEMHGHEYPRLVVDDASARTRDKILFHLKKRGPQTASVLARRLGVTPMAVRQHIYGLSEDGLVDYDDERHRVGRPRRVWKLAPAAQAEFPDSHADLTVELIDAMQNAFGVEGLDRLIVERTREQLERYRAQMPPRGASIQKKIAALAKIRRNEGYMAEWSKQRDGSFLLVENHCPICAAAQVCQTLCRDELTLIRSLLGKSTRVEREEHILAGARRCAYRIID
jgi:predicted ArsR family transcriptional regulator